MIISQVIDTLYKKYKKRPKSPDYLDLPLLFDTVGELHGLQINPDKGELEINSIDPKSPFHKIHLNRIHAIVPFEEWTAIVLHSSIIFLNRKNNKISINIKPHKPSFWDRISMFFHKD